MWKITKNNIDNFLPESPDFINGRRICKDTKKVRKFKMSDDDGNVYFEGVSSDWKTCEAFAPLYDYGRAFGCTDIYYKNNGRWEVL